MTFVHIKKVINYFVRAGGETGYEATYSTQWSVSHLVVHYIAIGLCGGLASEWSDITDELKGNDAERPPVAAHTIVCRAVQAGQHFRGYVLRSAHRQT